MAQHTKKFDRYFWILFFLSVLLLFPSLGKMPLWIYDEARNAECAREMWERHDWIVPTFNGALRTLKPPLHYFFMFGGFQMFGVSEWGARFFSAVFGVLTVLATYYFIARYSTKLHAFCTGLVLLASTHFLFQMRMSVPDPYLIFLNTVSIFASYAYFEEKKFSWLLVCAVTLGLGTLAKGPVSIALPGAALFVWLLWQKKGAAIFHWHILIAAIITLIIPLPWYLAVHKATNGEWTRGFFLEHNIGRFSEPMEGHGGLFIIVPIFVWAGLLPASVFIGESLRSFKTRFAGPFLRLAFCVMAVFVVFYSVSGTKLPNYPTPCYPFVALILGYFVSLGISKQVTSRFYPFLLLLLIAVALPVGLYFGIHKEVEMQGYESNALIALILTIGIIISIFLFKKRGFKPAVIGVCITYIVFNSIFFNYLYPLLYSNNPLSKTISQVRQYKNVAGYKIFQPSYTFYVPDRIPVFQTPDSLQAYLQTHEAVVITRLSLQSEIDSLGLKQVAAHHDIFENNTTLLLTNRKTGQ